MEGNRALGNIAGYMWSIHLENFNDKSDSQVWKKNLEESLMQRDGSEFVDSRAQSGEAEKGQHQLSGKLMGQTFSLALEMRKFSEESYEEHLAL